MNKTLPKHVILDLLPLYLEDEVSNETRTLLDICLEEDPQLRKLVEKAKAAIPMQAIPAPLKKETEMEALKKFHGRRAQRTKTG